MKVRLAKARSYMGHGVNVDRRNPVAEVTDEVGGRLIATGYFDAEKAGGPKGDAEVPEKKPGRKHGSAKGEDAAPGFER